MSSQTIAEGEDCGTGQGIFFIRSVVRARESAVEQKFLTKLPPDARHAYETALATSWIAQDLQAQIHQAAAEVLFPRDPEAYEKMGAMYAQAKLTTVYRFLLSFLSLKTLAERADLFWRQDNTRGSIRIEGSWSRDKRGAVVLADYPEYPLCLRRFLTGFLQQMLSAARAKNVKVQHVDTYDDGWRWTVRWE